MILYVEYCLGKGKNVWGGEYLLEFCPEVIVVCQNYVKLPEYSSIDIMKVKISYAINEGQNNFTLSSRY